jgi:serine/threonine-protein kinase
VRAVGDKIGGRYEIVSVAGQRPLGMLYRAIDLEIGVDVALRILSPQLLPDAAARQAFVLKLSKSKSFSHANIVKLYDVKVDGDEVAVSVQFAPGQVLADRIAERPLAFAEVRPILKQVAAGITHAHQHGIVLGDVRAETVTVLESALKLSNVGIGPALPRNHYLEAVRDTPAYPRLAPEIRAGGPAEPRADVYALALLVVEMMTGKLPTTPLQIKDAPPALVSVLARALSEDPLLRQSSVDSLAHELDAIFSGGVLVQRAPGRDSAELTPLLPTLPPLPTPSGPTLTNAPPIGDSAEMHTKEMPKLPGLADEEETRPGNSLVASGEQTRQVSPEELDRLRGAEVTRLVSEEEIFPFRVQSSDTQQIELDMIVKEAGAADDDEDLELEVVRDADGTVRSPIPKPSDSDSTIPGPTVEASDAEELKTSEVILLEPDQAYTVPVPRTEEPMPPPPPEIEVESAPPIKLPRAESADTADGTPLPPPAPAPPTIGAEDFGDDSTKTNQVPKLAAVSDDAPTKSNDLPPRARELVVPDRAPRPAIPIPILPKIEVQLPIEARNASPALGVPALKEAEPVQRPQRRTQEVPALPAPPRTRARWIIVLVMGFFVAATAIVIAVMMHMQDLRRQHDRAEKQRLADELRARAEALRHPQVPGAPPPAPAPTPRPAMPAPTGPQVTPMGPCPLGSNLVEGKPGFCVDVYEYPGGKTIPRTSVSFDEAQKLCQSRGERMCTEMEWEHACRGKGGASYPYGATFDSERCNTRSGQISPAGDFKECRSGSGAYDMSGNVAEWVIARGQPAQKGGAAAGANPSHASRCSNTAHGMGPEGGVFVGFRCCADPKR